MGADLSMNPPKYVRRLITDGGLLRLQGKYDYERDIDWQTTSSVPDTPATRDAYASVGLHVTEPAIIPLMDRLKLGARQPEALRIIDAWLREQTDLSEALQNLYGLP